MAKIKFGMMMTDARGKLGGQVFSKNRSGAYVRTKVTPVNPRTNSQQANRSLLGSLSSEWSGLSEEQRNAWNSAVSEWQKTNVFGDLQKPTGKNLFTSLNKNIQTSFPADPILLLPPSKSEFVALVLRDVTVSSVNGTLTITLGASIGVDNYIRVSATPPVSAGTTFVKNQLRVITEGINSPTASYTVANAYNDRFGTVQAGDKIFIQVQQVIPNGQVSPPQMVIATIVGA